MKDFVVVLCGGPLDGEVVESDGGEAIAWVAQNADGIRKTHRSKWEWFCDAEGAPWLCNAVYDGVSDEYSTGWWEL